MKKLLVVAFICSTLPAFSFGELPIVPINETSPMHDMQTMQAQRFRHEELNYYNDVDTEKAKFKKRTQTDDEKVQEVKQQIQQAAQQKINSYGKSEFVRENGQVKIKYSN